MAYLIFPLILFSVYLWYTFAIVYHFIRFGIGHKPKTLAFVFLIGSFALFSISFLAFWQVDWNNLLAPPLL